ILQKMVIENDGGDRGEKARSSSDECFSDAGCDSAKAGSACAAEAGKGINDAPNGSEEANERRDRARGGEPGHSLFDAANFFGGIMAQETTEKKSRSRRTMRATKPVCLRMSRRSVTKIAVNRKMTYPSVETKFFLGVQNVAHASRARNK